MPIDSRPLHEFLRFALVGALQNGVNLATFAIAILVGVPLLLAAALAAIIALAVSFGFNRAWAFKDRKDRARVRAARFVTIWTTFVLLGPPTLAALVHVFHLPRVLAQAIVILVGAPFSYIAHRRWTFRVESADASLPAADALRRVS
jgi:putative flippase GtrA